MAGLPRPVTDEVDGLLTFLDQQRQALRASVYLLSEEQARSRPVPSSDISLAGLLKHVALTEQHWIVHNMVQRDIPDFPPFDQIWVLGEGETVAGWLDRYAAVAAETEEIVRGLPDLEVPVPVPPAPWFPKDVEAWSARWVLLHLIEETARHAGHADIIRESIDGATMFPLLAAYENGTEVRELRF